MGDDLRRDGAEASPDPAAHGGAESGPRSAGQDGRAASAGVPQRAGQRVNMDENRAKRLARLKGYNKARKSAKCVNTGRAAPEAATGATLTEADGAPPRIWTKPVDVVEVAPVRQFSADELQHHQVDYVCRLLRGMGVRVDTAVFGAGRTSDALDACARAAFHVTLNAADATGSTGAVGTTRNYATEEDTVMFLEDEGSSIDHRSKWGAILGAWRVRDYVPLVGPLPGDAGDATGLGSAGDAAARANRRDWSDYLGAAWCRLDTIERELHVCPNVASEVRTWMTSTATYLVRMMTTEAASAFGSRVAEQLMGVASAGPLRSRLLGDIAAAVTAPGTKPPQIHRDYIPLLNAIVTTLFDGSFRVTSAEVSQASLTPGLPFLHGVLAFVKHKAFANFLVQHEVFLNPRADTHSKRAAAVRRTFLGRTLGCGLFGYVNSTIFPEGHVMAMLGEAVQGDASVDRGVLIGAASRISGGLDTIQTTVNEIVTGICAAGPDARTLTVKWMLQSLVGARTRKVVLGQPLGSEPPESCGFLVRLFGCALNLFARAADEERVGKLVDPRVLVTTQFDVNMADESSLAVTEDVSGSRAQDVRNQNRQYQLVTAVNTALEEVGGDALGADNMAKALEAAHDGDVSFGFTSKLFLVCAFAISRCYVPLGTADRQLRHAIRNARASDNPEQVVKLICLKYAYETLFSYEKIRISVGKYCAFLFRFLAEWADVKPGSVVHPARPCDMGDGSVNTKFVAVRECVIGDLQTAVVTLNGILRDSAIFDPELTGQLMQLTWSACDPRWTLTTASLVIGSRLHVLNPHTRAAFGQVLYNVLEGTAGSGRGNTRRGMALQGISALDSERSFARVFERTAFAQAHLIDGLLVSFFEADFSGEHTAYYAALDDRSVIIRQLETLWSARGFKAILAFLCVRNRYLVFSKFMGKLVEGLSVFGDGACDMVASVYRKTQKAREMRAAPAGKYSQEDIDELLQSAEGEKNIVRWNMNGAEECMRILMRFSEFLPYAFLHESFVTRLVGALDAILVGNRKVLSGKEGDMLFGTGQGQIRFDPLELETGVIVVLCSLFKPEEPQRLDSGGAANTVAAQRGETHPVRHFLFHKSFNDDLTFVGLSEDETKGVFAEVGQPVPAIGDESDGTPSASHVGSTNVMDEDTYQERVEAGRQQVVRLLHAEEKARSDSGQTGGYYEGYLRQSAHNISYGQRRVLKSLVEAVSGVVVQTQEDIIWDILEQYEVDVPEQYSTLDTFLLMDPVRCNNDKCHNVEDRGFFVRAIQQRRSCYFCQSSMTVADLVEHGEMREAVREWMEALMEVRTLGDDTGKVAEWKERMQSWQVPKDLKEWLADGGE